MCSHHFCEFILTPLNLNRRQRDSQKAKKAHIFLPRLLALLFLSVSPSALSMTKQGDNRRDSAKGGLLAALGAHAIWGLLPLYLFLVRHVPPVEFVGWRVVFTLPFCLLLVALAGQSSDLRAALADRHRLTLLTLSALLIGSNWLIYIVAVQEGHNLATSLGYYICPLVNVLLGTLFLGERLSRVQWLAVGMACIGVSVLAWEARDMLFISLGLAATFGTYGLVKRKLAVPALSGMTVESLILLAPAFGLIVWQANGSGGAHVGGQGWGDVAVVASGIVTAVPLMLFAFAARRLDLSTLGFIQYLAPTIVFISALTFFDETMRDVQLISFVLIWAAIALFSWDMWRRKAGG